jgi:hypothetical protein
MHRTHGVFDREARQSAFAVEGPAARHIAALARIALAFGAGAGAAFPVVEADAIEQAFRIAG